MTEQKYWLWESGMLGAALTLTFVSILMIFITITEFSIFTIMITLLIIGTFGGLIIDKKKYKKKHTNKPKKR